LATTRGTTTASIPKTVTGGPSDTGIGGCFYKSVGEDCIDTGKICGASAACASADGARGAGASASASGNGRCTVAMAQAGIPVGGDTADYGAGGSDGFGCPRPPGAVKRPKRSLAFSYENPFCVGLLYGRAGRLNTKNAGFRPGQ
jgi:hypothetical protein